MLTNENCVTNIWIKLVLDWKKLPVFKKWVIAGMLQIPLSMFLPKIDEIGWHLMIWQRYHKNKKDYVFFWDTV